MALNPKLSNQAASTAADAVTTRFDNGYLLIYTAPQPANANTGITTQTLLATLRFASPAFNPASNGVASANFITGESDAPATGVPAWFRCLESDAATEIVDGSIGTSDANMVLSTGVINIHDTVSITSGTYVQKQS